MQTGTSTEQDADIARNLLDSKIWHSTELRVVLSATLARDLQAKVGDTVTLSLRKASAVPRETLLGRRGAAEVLETLKVAVQAVLPERSFGSDLNLAPTPAPPLNAFVPLWMLEQRLGIA